MKFYATVTSERATKGQGGNKHLEININVDSKTPTYRARVIDDELLGIVYIAFQSFHFGKWTTLYETEQFYNVAEKIKGNKQKDKFCSQCSPTGKGYMQGVCENCKILNAKWDKENGS